MPRKRKCWVCGESKPLNKKHFYRDIQDHHGFQAACRACQLERNLKYQADHREYFKLKGRENYDPSQNKGRYLRYREDYLRRRDIYSRTTRGRLVTVLYSAKMRAEKKSLCFAISIDWLTARFEAQGGMCALTGIKLTFGHVQGKGHRYSPFSPSLDRINPRLGYTTRNTRLVCTAVNLALNSFGEEILRQVCEGYLRTG